MNTRLSGSPTRFLYHLLGDLPHRDLLLSQETWWRQQGEADSAGVDRAGTPWLRMFDARGERVDEILFPGGYRELLLAGYRAGSVWRALDEPSLAASFQLGYLTAYFDPGLYCPHTVSLATALALAKYGTPPLQERFLAPLLRRDETVWQGATWMTEIDGGSDLGAAVQTVAVPAGDHWRLSGEKYFASNVGAELAVVAARPQGAPTGVRGLALFLVPQRRADGQANFAVRRLKDKIGTRSVPTGEVVLEGSEGYLLGTAETGIYQILEVLNVSRTANSIAAVALAQRAIDDARDFAAHRVAFGRPVLEQPLLARQFAARGQALEEAFALAWESVRLLDAVWRERAPYSERYHLFRLVAHLAKYWTAEFAVQTAKWGIEVHGGLGVLAEFPAERRLREALVLAIWEGTSHRQILDGLEVMERKQAHLALRRHLAGCGGEEELAELYLRLERQLGLPAAEREAEAEPLFAELAALSARLLRRRLGA
jgi:alkylation response protein AidB-like acyl-CoA dehydrogenase